MSGKPVFRWIWLVLVYTASVESLNWTAQPANPTEVTQGQEVSLTWNYTLTAEEQNKSQAYFMVNWQKFDFSTSSFHHFGSYFKLANPPQPIFSEPNAPRIVIDTSTGTSSASLQFKDVRSEDEGMYKIQVSLESNVFVAHQEFKVTVLVPSGIAYVSSDQMVCERSLVSLSCNATGKPTPTLNWTRVEDNGTDSAPLLPVVDGKYVVSYAQRSASGTYRCTADNGVGSPVNRTVRVKVEYSAAVDRIIKSSNTVIEGDSFNMTCEASGDPEPNVHWIKVDSNQRTDGNILNFTKVSRNDGGNYRCVADNKCGSNTSEQSFEVFYDPASVILVTNTTEDSYCSDLWVNFTCNASDANPAISNYLLYERDKVVAASSSGSWIEKLSEGKKHVYHCLAEHTVGNVNSTNTVTLTVNVSASVVAVNTTNYTEGENAILFCEVSGVPSPVVSLYNDTNQQVNDGALWKLPNISRNDNGTYQCIANNTCGMDSKTFDIIVQYKPGDFNFTPDISNSRVCAEHIVNFTCSADANPVVYSYTLFENSSVVNTNSLGEWTRAFKTAGRFVFRCKASNSVGSDNSSDITVSVEVPAKLISVNTTNFTEGENVILFCEVDGVPRPVVSWYNDTNEQVNDGVLWKLPNISRSDNGTYKCIANNTCGRDSKTFDVIVQYKPGDVRLTLDISNSRVCAEHIVNFTCSADANPAVDSYTLFENGSVVNTNSLGAWTKKFNTTGQFVFRCEASNSVGSDNSSDITVDVEVPASVISVNTSIFTEGKNVTLFCNVSGEPFPRVSFINRANEEVNDGPIWRLPNISRNDNGTYKCRANNTCHVDIKSVDIVVHFPAEEVSHSKIINVTVGDFANLSCPVDGRPEPNITWYEVNKTTGDAAHEEKDWIFQANYSAGGWYTCSAMNYLNPFPVNVSVQLIVVRVPSTASPTPTSALPSTASPPPTSEQGSQEFNGTCCIKNKDCNNQSHVTEVKENFCHVIPTINGLENITSCQVNRAGCGCSIVVDFVLRFSRSVSSSYVLSALRTAAEDGTFGGYDVDPKSIKQTTSRATESTPALTCTEPSFLQDNECKTKIWIIIVFVVVGVILFALVIAAVAWWVHKKRKCRKDPRIHNSESEVLHNQNDIEDGAYARVNSGYAVSGPPSANGSKAPEEQQQQQQAAAAPPAYAVVDKSKKQNKEEKNGNENIPDYAVVDKSKKKKKDETEKSKKEEKNKGDKNADANVPEYAAVNKSKKKKKEEDEHAYASVDMSKKSKKQKRKPGEVLYADLGDFQPVRQMPAVSISPEPLPPIKRPTPYQETQYADITQFMTGNVTLPAGQETEMEPTYANSGGDQGAATKDKPNTGQEDAEPKETPM